MSLAAGIDIGSITTKAAILRDGAFLGTKVIFTGYNAEGAGRRNPRGDRLLKGKTAPVAGAGRSNP